MYKYRYYRVTKVLKLKLLIHLVLWALKNGCRAMNLDQDLNGYVGSLLLMYCLHNQQGEALHVFYLVLLTHYEISHYLFAQYCFRQGSCG